MGKENAYISRRPGIRLIAVLCLFMYVAATVSAYEPVTALDDAFTVPRNSRLAECAATFPGVESLVGHEYAVLAWQRPFGIDELAVSTIHAGIVFGSFGVSGTFSASGFDLYSEELLKLGLSYAPLSGLSTGIRLTHPRIHIKGFGSADTYALDAGIVWQPVKPVLVALAAEDLGNTKFGKSREPLDGATKLSLSWQADSMFTVFAAVHNVPRYDVSATAGFTAKVAGPLTVGAAAGIEPDRFEYLAEIVFRGFRFSYRGVFHPELGSSSGYVFTWDGWAQQDEE